MRFKKIFSSSKEWTGKRHKINIAQVCEAALITSVKSLAASAGGGGGKMLKVVFESAFRQFFVVIIIIFLFPEKNLFNPEKQTPRSNSAHSKKYILPLGF
jgi:hypothetical protein